MQYFNENKKCFRYVFNENKKCLYFISNKNEKCLESYLNFDKNTGRKHFISTRLIQICIFIFVLFFLQSVPVLP